MNKKPEGKLIFRTAEPNDADEIAVLVNSVYRGDNAKKGWTTEADLLDGIRINANKVNEIIKSDNNAILLALNKLKIIGCVHLEKKGNRSHLGMLSVDVNFQNCGIGRMLMDKSEE